METIQRALDLAARQRGSPGLAEADVSANTGVFDKTTMRVEPPVPEPALRLPVDWEELRESRVVDRNDRRPAARAYRMLRTQVLQRARAHGISTIGVVSAAKGEGKTITAINLALSIAAEPNQSVLLMDLDLRNPSVAQVLRLPLERGLESWFAGLVQVEELRCSIEGVDRLSLLPTLAPVPGSSEALAAAATAGLLKDLKARDPQRLVIVDLPPVLLSDDALTVAPHLDAVVLVVAEARTHRDDVERVLELLGNTRVIGTVLNCSSESENRAY
ncbi:MAG TPA: CpsD/CapB family tyrosine-protein kinase [Steroidobacteraceae bacterium]|nr:CpsD/CapB family tyrosine-protein kinase [Steroidobacteraceae bacterium]